MALQVSNIKRSFELEKNGKTIILADPNPNMTPEEVVKFYASTYPELTNAMVQGPVVKGDKATYTATTKAGKLG